MLWNLRYVGRYQEQCKKSAAQRGQHALTRDPFVATHRTELRGTSSQTRRRSRMKNINTFCNNWGWSSQTKTCMQYERFV